LSKDEFKHNAYSLKNSE